MTSHAPSKIPSPRKQGRAKKTTTTRSKAWLFLIAWCCLLLCLYNFHFGIQEEQKGIPDRQDTVPLPRQRSKPRRKTASTNNNIVPAQEKRLAPQHKVVGHVGHNHIESKAAKPLNILLLYADDWSYRTLGAMGNPFVKTPRLDQMARDGVLFTHNAVTTSICMVSRATLYTGQYASCHQTWTSYENLTMYEEGKWNQTLYPLLHQHGYYVGFFGKYHHRRPPQNAPKAFDESIFYEKSHYKTRHGITKHITQWNEDDAMDFLTSKRRPRDKPFALTVSFFATHADEGSLEEYRPMNKTMWLYENQTVPIPRTFTEDHWEALPYFFTKRNFGRMRAKKRYYPSEKYQVNMKNTYRMAYEVDGTVGRLLDELDRQGILNETLVVFTTDNGNFHGHHGLAEKWYAYEESLRVPLIILDPRMAKTVRGSKNDEFTLSIDLAPTLLGAAHIPIPDVMQGRDMSQLYLGSSSSTCSWRKEFYYEWFHDSLDALPSNVALVRKDYKYINWTTFRGYQQLFDMVNDPWEERDIFNQTSADEPTRVTAMQARLFELQSKAANCLKI